MSMKWARLATSDVATTSLPSGLTPMPSGSGPTLHFAGDPAAREVEEGDRAMVLVGDVERAPSGLMREPLGVGAGS